MNTLRPRGGILLVSLWLVLTVGLRAELVLDDPGRFAVDMPAPHARAEQETTSGLGKTTLHLLTHDSADGKSAEILGYNDYPDGSVAKIDLAVTYKNVMDGVLKSMESDIKTSGEHKLGDVTGRDYTFVSKDGKLAGHVRCYFVGDRLYQLMYLGPPDTESGEESLHFLNSFRLLH